MLDEDRIIRDARRSRELERLLVVVGEQLRMVVRTPQPFDPPSGTTVLLLPCAPRDLAIGNVAEQHMLEEVMRVAGDRRSSLAGNEVLPLQGAQQPLRLSEVDPSRGGDTAKPEDLAVHRCLLKQLLLAAGQRVDSRSDDTLHRFRKL